MWLVQVKFSLVVTDDMQERVAELKEVPLNQQWPDEEKNFTPWLAKNISKLSNAVEIDLEIQDTEVNVGGYYADIHATDLEGERDVVIENQYNVSDHRHLGQSLIYSGALDADVIIWVAEEFKDAYIDAIQWFNKRTDNKTGFFAVEASLVRIEDSPVAPRFDVVARPSSWAVPSGLSDTEQEHREFWHSFEQHLAERGLQKYIMNKPPTRAAYRPIRIGEDYLRPSATTRDEVFCRLRVEDESGEFAGLDREDVEETMRSYWQEMDTTPISEEEINSLEWQSNPGQVYDSIVLQYSGAVDRSDETQWDTYQEWLVDATVLFDRTFSGRL